jgi:hypothetical protein
MSDTDPTPETPVTIGDRLAWFRGDLVAKFDALALQLATQHTELLAKLDTIAADSTLAQLLSAIQAGASGGATMAAIGPLEDFPQGMTVRYLLYHIWQAIDAAIVPSVSLYPFAEQAPVAGCTGFPTDRWIQAKRWNSVISTELNSVSYFAEFYPPVGAMGLSLSEVPVYGGSYVQSLLKTNVTSQYCVTALSVDMPVTTVSLSAVSPVDGGEYYQTGIDVSPAGSSPTETLVEIAGPPVMHYVSFTTINTQVVIEPDIKIWMRGGPLG